MLPHAQPPPGNSMFSESGASFDVFHDSWNVSAKTNNSLSRSAITKLPEAKPERRV